MEKDSEVRRSECTVCPPWVMCAHFEGQILWLSSRRQSRHLYNSADYGVAVGGEVGPCMQSLCGDGCLEPSLYITAYEYMDRALETDSFADAEAEFRRREDALLGREA